MVKELICAIKDPAYTCNEHQVRCISTNELIPVDLDSRDEFIDYHRKYLNAHDIDLLGDEESGIMIDEQSSKLVLYFVHLLNYQNTLEGNESVHPKLFYPVGLINCQPSMVEAEDVSRN